MTEKQTTTYRMRELKFRAWDYTRETMSPVTNNGWEWDKAHDYRALQYTGLKDKNGREIYEEDILKYHDITYNFKPEQVHIGVVVWRDNNAGFICERRIIDGRSVKPEYGMSGIHFKFAEVIGNIYENPELLKNTEAAK